MKDRTKIRYNTNFLSDEYHVFGEGYPTAAQAFRQIEANSYSIDADVSIMSVLTSIQKKGDMLQTVLLDGNDELVIVDGMVVLKDASFVNIKCKPETGYVDEGSLFFYLGGCYKTPITIDDYNLLVVGASALKTLSNLLKLEHLQRGFFRDASIAAKCSSYPDEKILNLFIREYHNVKKVFAAFSATDGMEFLRFEELWRVIRETAPGTKVKKWYITQQVREASFECPDGKAFSVTWSDTAYSSFVFTCEGKTERRKKKDELFDLIDETISNEPVGNIQDSSIEASAKVNIYCLRPDYVDPEIILPAETDIDIDWKKTFRIDHDELPFIYVYPQNTIKYEGIERSAI